MKSKKVLVTGGAGFIGSHIVDELLRLDYKVIILDNLINGKIENIYNNLMHNCNTLTFRKGDIRNIKLLNRIMKDVDYVIHQGALVNVSESMDNPTEYYDVNVTGTLKRILPDMALLCIIGIVFFLGAYVAFLKYDVR